MLKQQFRMGDYQYTPLGKVTINGVSAQLWMVRMLLDGAWVLYRKSYAPVHITRSKLITYLGTK